MKLFILDDSYRIVIAMLISILLYSPYKVLNVFFVITTAIIWKFGVFIWGQEGEVNYDHFFDNSQILVYMILTIVFASFLFGKLF